MIEEWKPVVGWEWLYEISNLGRMKSIRYWKQKFLNLIISNKWYSTTRLYLKWIWENKIVSRLVAQHFIPNPNNLPLSCHKDETLDENWALYNWEDNLFWGTYKDNMRDMISKWRDKCNFKLNHPKVWKWKFWKDHNSSIKILQYDLNWNFIKEWDSLSTVQKLIGLKYSNISSCCSLKRKTAGWFIWKYKNK